MFENPRRGRQARNFTTNVSKILDLKSASEQIFFRKLSLGAPEQYCLQLDIHHTVFFIRARCLVLLVVNDFTDIDLRRQVPLSCLCFPPGY